MDFRVDFPTLTLLIVKKYTMVVAIVWYIVIYGFSVTLVTAKSKNSCDAGAYTRARRWFFRKVCTLKKQNWEKGKNDWETVGNEWQNLLASMQVSVKKTDVSFYRKQRVVLLKTTCRFVENNVLFFLKWRVVWTEIGEKEWLISPSSEKKV